MASIENRIVQMQFDNTAFEKRLSTTMQSLDKLNQTIANAGSRNGLSNLSDSVKGFNLAPMTAAIDGVSAKFLALSTIGITVLSTIVSRAIDAGARIASALSLRPVMEGFQEYQTQIGAIQTILANTQSKGTNLDQVNSALDQLNEYSDKTIYNFTEMTRNIGTFTAAGVGLDQSVQSIKGIANLAAISGSNSQQASTAMYQLSQAIATGSVKLMDWNSVVNAGMGGEVFQKALFETGKMMGTINDVPLDKTFEEWTAGGNSFRGSLEQGWLTSEVLTNTLAGFTGELTRAQIMSMGYTEEQAIEIERLGTLGVESATKVRTLKALIDTTKEALQSGWASSFRLIFGDFNEATSLFTDLSGAISGFIQKNALARNEMLSVWKYVGGRQAVIEGLQNAFSVFATILQPIQDAFRNIFPPITGFRLAELSEGFRDLMAALIPGQETIDRIRRIFTGFFGALEIGWNVLKETGKFIADLFTSLTGAGSGKFLEFAAKIGDFFTDLNAKLVTGGGIAKFFDDLSSKIPGVIEYLIELKNKALDFFTAAMIASIPLVQKVIELKDKFVEFFGNFVEKAGPVIDALKNIADGVKDFFTNIGQGGVDVAAAGVERLGQRFGGLKDALGKIGDLWGPFRDALDKVREVLDPIWEYIKTWFSELGTKLADVFGPGDFDTVVDAVNVGLLGGILGILVKFFKDGFKFDLGDGLFQGIGRTFDELTGTLKAMQTEIKADALLKIAGSIAVLTASVLVLSMIDSANLTKALTAMAVGFGQLVGAFALLNALALGPSTAVKMGILATGLLILGGAMLILAVAVKLLSTMGWEELAKGLVGVGALLVMLTAVAGPLGNASGGMIRAGIGMTAIGLGLIVLAGAVKLFSMFSWADMGKGLVGVGGGLVIIAAGMHLMPNNMASKSAGLLLTAVALNILAGAVKLFATMKWSEMGKGMLGIGGGLLIIAAGMRLMPNNMLLTGAGLVVVATGLNIMAKALGTFGGMSWGEIGKGLIVLAGALLILAVATNAMSGAIGGAIAIGIVSASLMLLVTVIKEIGKLKISELVTGLIGLAAVLGILGAAAFLLAPLTPALLGLGAALVVVGLGFALFGAGAALVAVAFETIARVGTAGIGALMAVIDAIIPRIPALIAAFAEGLVQLAMVFIDAAPILIDGLKVILEHLLTTIIELMPKIGEALGAIITTILTLLREKIPEFIQLGIELLISLLTGIRDNIGQVVTLAAEIIANFVNGLAANMPMIVTAAVNLITSFIDSIAANIGRIIESAVNLLVQFVSGITNNMGKVVTAVGTLITTFISEVANLYSRIITAGTDALIQFLSGITNNLSKVITAVVTIITTFVTEVGANASRLITAGTDALVDFLEGISKNMIKVITTVADIITEFIEAVGRNASRVIRAGVDTVLDFLEGVGKNAVAIAIGAADVIIDFVNGLANAIRAKSGELRSAGMNMATALLDGITFGLSSKAGNVISDAVGIGSRIASGIGGALGIGSPSRLMIQYGKWVMEGLAVGMAATNDPEISAVKQVKNMTEKVEDALRNFTDSIEGMNNLNPTITPVIDLTNVRRGFGQMSSMMPEVQINPYVSYSRASSIASTTREQADLTATNDGPAPGEVKFEQNIYSPTALSTGDIYKQTRNQLAMAKEELSIPS